MSNKYTILAVAYKDISPEVETKINAYSVRMIDEASDLVNYCTYGRQFDQNSRVCIYLEWYQKNILNYLGKGYKVVLLEIPFNSNEPIVNAIDQLDIEFGDKVLVIEHDNV